jgi:ketosteroid isomerase-like protein
MVDTNERKPMQKRSAPVESGISVFNEEEIRIFARRFETLFNEREAAAMAAYYANDARILAKDTDVSGGRHAIEEFWKQASSHEAIQERTIRVMKVDSVVEMGYVLSVVKLKLLGPDGQSCTKTVNDVTVWKRNSAAKWEIILDFAASPVTSTEGNLP